VTAEHCRRNIAAVTLPAVTLLALRFAIGRHPAESLSAAKGGALCSSTEPERAHPYSLESTRRPREATRGSALPGPESRERCGSRYSYPFLVERVRIFCSEFVTATRLGPRLTGRMPRCFTWSVGRVGVLRLRRCFASRSGYSAQDDIFVWTWAGESLPFRQLSYRLGNLRQPGVGGAAP